MLVSPIVVFLSESTCSDSAVNRWLFLMSVGEFVRLG